MKFLCEFKLDPRNNNFCYRERVIEAHTPEHAARQAVEQAQNPAIREVTVQAISSEVLHFEVSTKIEPKRNDDGEGGDCG